MKRLPSLVLAAVLVALPALAASPPNTVAAVSPPVSDVTISQQGCTPINPCAAVTPALGAAPVIAPAPDAPAADAAAPVTRAAAGNTSAAAARPAAGAAAQATCAPAGGRRGEGRGQFARGEGRGQFAAGQARGQFARGEGAGRQGGRRGPNPCAPAGARSGAQPPR